jgi:RNA polymerase sigma-70 factor (ECF subfamily)
LTPSAPLYLQDQTDYSDEELIRAAQANPQDFDALYRRYVGRVYAYLYSFTYDTSEAEDITSQTFLSAWKGLKNYREQGSFAGWLFRIARNKARDLHRQKRPHMSLDAAGDIPIEGDPASNYENKESLHRASELIGRLDLEQIELLRLRFGAGLSYAEIGSVIGRSPEAIKMVFHRLFQKLRSEWKMSDE